MLCSALLAVVVKKKVSGRNFEDLGMDPLCGWLFFPLLLLLVTVPQLARDRLYN